MLRTAMPAFRPLWLGALLVALLLVLYLPGLDSDALTHGDEAYWISAGAKSLALVEAGALTSPDWQTGTTASVLDVHHPTETAANRNPKLGALLIGLSVRLHDAPVPEVWHRDYAFGRSHDWNRRHGILPANETLGAARLPVVLLCVAGLLALFQLLARLEHPGWAFAGVIALATAPILAEAGRRAMLDGPALAFSAAPVAATAWALERPGRWTPALAAGLLLGAALASKLNAGLLIPVLVLAFGWQAWQRRSAASLAPAVAGGVAGFVLFVVTNPTLYPAPWSGIGSMLRIGSELEGLGDSFRSAALPTVGSRVARAAELLLFDNGLVHARLGLPLDLLLLPAGIALLARRLQEPAALVLLLWLGFALLAVCLWPPVRWDRYFLPALPPVVLTETLALAAGARFMLSRLRPNALPDAP